MTAKRPTLAEQTASTNRRLATLVTEMDRFRRTVEELLNAHHAGLAAFEARVLALEIEVEKLRSER